MGPLTIIAVAVVVVGVAYFLGTLMRLRDQTPPRVVDAKPRFAQTAKQAKPAVSAPPVSEDRQLKAVRDWLLTQAFEQTGVRVADEPLAYQRISEAAQKAMRDLKTQEAVSISLPFLTADASGPKHFETRLTREVLDELARY
jgi:hypothetical protein